MKKPLHNIFSRKPEKQTSFQPPKTLITIDTREKQSLVASHLIEQKANIKFEKLEIADYLINDIAIERKTFSDFTSSMIDKRLIQQLKEIKKYPKHFLIIESFYHNYQDSNIHENAIKGMFLSTILEFQVPIIFTKNEKDTAEFLILIAKKQDKQKMQKSIRPSKTFKSIKEQKQFILEGFPGIGPLTAKQLLQEFPNLKEIFNASKEQLRIIESFPEEKIQKFREILES